MTEQVERWRLRAAEWLDAQDAADILTETKADVFAEIKSRQDGKSEAEKDRMARTCSDWTEFRSNMIDAVSTARRLKMRMKYEEMLFDSFRTESANSRQELRRHQ